MADYPSAITSFPVLVDGVTPIEAGHHNDVAAEIVAIETELGINPRGSAPDLATRLNTMPGLITFVSPSADLFRCNATGYSDFVATIASISGSTLVYNAPTSGYEESIKPAATTHLAKLRIYNTTNSPADYLLVSDVDTTTNTITFTTAVPATWAIGETITSRSQTNTATTSGAYFQEFEVTSEVTNKSGLFIWVSWADSSTSGGYSVSFHPLASFLTAKNAAFGTQNANSYAVTTLIYLTDNVFTVRWTSSGAATATLAVRVLATIS